MPREKCLLIGFEIGSSNADGIVSEEETVA